MTCHPPSPQPPYPTLMNCKLAAILLPNVTGLPSCHNPRCQVYARQVSVRNLSEEQRMNGGLAVYVANTLVSTAFSVSLVFSGPQSLRWPFITGYRDLGLRFRLALRLEGRHWADEDTLFIPPAPIAFRRYTRLASHSIYLRTYIRLLKTYIRPAAWS